MDSWPTCSKTRPNSRAVRTCRRFIGSMRRCSLGTPRSSCALRAIVGARAQPIGCDLKDEKATRAAARDCIEKGGGLDILVHCAAYVGSTNAPGWSTPFEQQTVAAWNDAMSINVTAAFILAQEARDA